MIRKLNHNMCYMLSSLDPKPSDVPTGTVIQEYDTNDLYIFDGDNNMWIKLGSECFTEDNTQQELLVLTNCVNCSAPIDYSLEKCPYCGTPYHKKAERNYIKEDLLQIKINASQEMQTEMLMNGLITNHSLRRFHGL